MQLTKIMITRFFFFFFVFRILFLRRRIFPFEEWLRVMNEEHWPGPVALATSREQARTSNKRMEYFFIDEIVSNLWIFQHLYRHRYIFFCMYIIIYNNFILQCNKTVILIHVSKIFQRLINDLLIPLVSALTILFHSHYDRVMILFIMDG